MTCIVAVKDNTGITIGSDSQASTRYSKASLSQSKVFQIEDLYIGVSGYFRISQIIEHCLELPKRDDFLSDIAYLVKGVTAEIRKVLSEHKSIKQENSEDELNYTYLLLVYNNNIYQVDSNLQVLSYLDNYLSIGSGSEIAKGSLHTTEQYNIDRKTRVKLALEASAKHATGVGKPFRYINIQGEK